MKCAQKTVMLNQLPHEDECIKGAHECQRMLKGPLVATDSVGCPNWYLNVRTLVHPQIVVYPKLFGPFLGALVRRNLSSFARYRVCITTVP